MKSIFRLTVRGYELDSFGHVNNSVYLQYAEEAKWHFFEDSKVLEKLREYGYFPVILETNIRYMNELHMHDEVIIESTFSCTNAVVQFTHEMYNETRGKKASIVKGKLALVDKDRIICDIPDDIKERIKNYFEE